MSVPSGTLACVIVRAVISAPRWAIGGGKTHSRHTVPCRDALSDTAGNSGGALTDSDRCLLIIGDVANPIFEYATPAVGVQAAFGEGIECQRTTIAVDQIRAGCD